MLMFERTDMSGKRPSSWRFSVIRATPRRSPSRGDRGTPSTPLILSEPETSDASPATARASWFCPEPRSPQRLTISPRRTVEVDAPDPRADVDACELEHRLPRGVAAPFAMERSRDLLAERELHELLHRGLGARELGDDAAVPQHGRTVANAQYLPVAVADEDDRHTLVAQSLDDAEEAIDVGLTESGGRLVEDQDPRLSQREHLRDLDELTFGERDLSDLLRRVDAGHAHPSEHARGGLREAALVDREPVRRLEAERDVVCDREVRQQARAPGRRCRCRAHAPRRGVETSTSSPSISMRPDVGR